MFEYFIAMYADPILRLLLTALGGCLGVFAAKIFRTYINDKTKLTVAKAAVACVQQVWYALDGPGKMDKAMELMAAELARKGVKFDADEMWMYAEAAIAEFKGAFRKPAQKEDTAAAVNARAPGVVCPFEDDDRTTSGLLE
jgi:hypothetical protein